MKETLLLCDLPTVIETDRLKLRVPQAHDGQGVHDAILDGYEDCVKYLFWPKEPPTAQKVEEDCRIHQTEFILREQLRFICIEKDSGNIIGRFAFPEPLCVWSVPTLAISYFLRKSAQGKGYATEASNALIRYAFEVLKAKKVEIHCDQLNLKSNGFPKRLGMQIECERIGTWPSLDGSNFSTVNIYATYDTKSLPKLITNW